MKRLICEYPQDFASWLVKRSLFIRELSAHLKNRSIDADALYNILSDEVSVLLHVEFQTYGDPKMERRLWEYNVQATCEHNCLVYSFVIYLTKCKVAESPYVWAHPNGREVHRFHFEVIKLWEVSTEELRQAGLIGLIPLLTLTRDGARREVVEEMIESLAPAGEEPHGALLALAYTIASLVFTNEPDREWIRRRFAMLRDVLRESWAYQEIMQEGHEEGIQEGRQEGVNEQRQTLMEIVQARFPEIVSLGEEVASAYSDLPTLRRLSVQISIARDEEEARDILRSFYESGKADTK